MFPSGFFAPAFFAPRYFPRPAADVVSNPQPDAVWGLFDRTASWGVTMVAAASLFEQRLYPFAAGEDVAQPFIGRSLEDPTDWALRFTLSTHGGATPAVAVEDGDIDRAVIESGGEYVATFTVPLARADTLDLIERLYVFDLWRVDSGNNVRLAAGTVPVKNPARLDE